MSDFLNNINLIHKNWLPSKKWESELLENKEKDKILIKNSIDQLQMQTTEKIENLIKNIKNLEAEAKALTEEAKRLTDRKKATENKIDRLKDYLKDISNVDIKRFSALQPIEIQGLYDREWLCPSCRTKVGDCCEVDNFCKHCGQKIEFNLRTILKKSEGIH